MIAVFLSLLGCSGGPDVKISTYNTPPSVILLSPTDGDSFEEGELVQFDAKISDSFDSPPDLSFIWASDIDGELLGGTPADASGSLVYSTANLSPGSHVVTLTVLDTDQASSNATVNIEVVDLPEDPTIEIVQPTPSQEGVEGETVDLMASVWDARDDLDTLIVDMESDIDGILCQVNPNSDGLSSCSHAFSAGTHVLQFTVTNSAGYDASATLYFDVISLLDIDDDGDGFTENQGDCDDSNPEVKPGATEVPNTLDDDCDNIIDEGTTFYDDDGDGLSEIEGDCNDANPNISPNLPEICSDGIDNNCNSSQNEENADGCTVFYRDSDGDGRGDPSFSECWCTAGGSTGEFDVTNSDDCYDGNAAARPGQTGYYTTHRGDGSFDYNCDGTPSKQYNTAGACNGITTIGDCTMDTAGWSGSVPACGNSGNYILDNDSCSAGCYINLGLTQIPTCCTIGGPSYSSRTQACQ